MHDHLRMAEDLQTKIAKIAMLAAAVAVAGLEKMHPHKVKIRKILEREKNSIPKLLIKNLSIKSQILILKNLDQTPWFNPQLQVRRLLPAELTKLNHDMRLYLII